MKSVYIELHCYEFYCQRTYKNTDLKG